MIVSIGLTSTLLLEAGGKRGVYLSNRGENTVWLKFGESAVVGEGIPLDKGDKLSLNSELDDCGKRIFAIAENAATNISAYSFR